jgi:hypothetical protein
MRNTFVKVAAITATTASISVLNLVVNFSAKAASLGFDVTSVGLGQLTQSSVSTVNGITYLNQTLPITSFSANGKTWLPGEAPFEVIVRRSGSIPTDDFGNYNNREVISSELLPGASPTTLRIPEPTTTQATLRANNILETVDNVFVNTGYINGIQTDIERVDFVTSSGIKTSSDRAVTLFDRGPNDKHDPFKIAPILSIDSAGNPTSYGNLLSVPIGWGLTNLRPGGAADQNLNYTIVTNSTGAFSNVLNVSQQIGGILIPLSNLATPSTTIYGYSLFAPDVNDNGNPANLIDWKNASIFPLDTPNAVGGIDLVATNVGVAKAVPEPGMLLGTLFAGGLLFVKRKSSGKKLLN